MSSAPPPSAIAGASAEAQAAAFASDHRIHFSRETGTWRLEEDDGTELEYDATKGIWVAVVRCRVVILGNEVYRELASFVYRLTRIL